MASEIGIRGGGVIGVREDGKRGKEDRGVEVITGSRVEREAAEGVEGDREQGGKDEIGLTGGGRAEENDGLEKRLSMKAE